MKTNWWDRWGFWTMMAITAGVLIFAAIMDIFFGWNLYHFKD